jgi:excisionase family DNA binding protein
MSEKLLVSIAEAAAMASIGRSTAYALIARGEWPTVSIGSTRKVPVEALREWVRQRTQATMESAPAAAEAGQRNLNHSGSDES